MEHCWNPALILSSDNSMEVPEGHEPGHQHWGGTDMDMEMDINTSERKIVISDSGLLQYWGELLVIVDILSNPIPD